MDHDSVAWLQTWLIQQSTDDWRLGSGISVQTLDNPGWWVVIDLAGTGLESRPFVELHRISEKSDWMQCKVDGGKFQGLGGPCRLAEILSIFQAWASQTKLGMTGCDQTETDWLLRWYASQCDGDWEHCYGIKINSVEGPAWQVLIELEETELESTIFTTVERDANASDWLRCKVEEAGSAGPYRVFKGSGDPSKLIDILKAFRTWASGTPRRLRPPDAGPRSGWVGTGVPEES